MVNKIFLSKSIFDNLNYFIARIYYELKLCSLKLVLILREQLKKNKYANKKCVFTRVIFTKKKSRSRCTNQSTLN